MRTCHGSSFVISVNRLAAAYESRKNLSLLLITEVFIIDALAAMIFTISTWSRKIDLCAIVRIRCRSEVSSNGTHRYALGISSRESRLRGIFIAGGENRETAVDGAVWRTGIMNEVVNRFFFKRIGFLPLFLGSETRHIAIDRISFCRVVTPAALKDYSPIVSGIFDGSCLAPEGSGSRAVKNLTGHNLHSGIRSSVTTCNAADTDAVAVDSCNGPCHVGSMSGITVACKSNVAIVSDEVIAINISLIPVAVSIIARVQCLSFIDPHVAGKVRMGVHHALIQDCYNDRRVA